MSKLTYMSKLTKSCIRAYSACFGNSITEAVVVRKKCLAKSVMNNIQELVHEKVTSKKCHKQYTRTHLLIVKS